METEILLLWIVIETFFGPDNLGETVYRLSQRIALFLGKDQEERVALYGQAKNGYNWRSKIAHGIPLSKLTLEKSVVVIDKTEYLVRKAFLRILEDEVFMSRFASDREEFLDSLVFSKTIS